MKKIIAVVCLFLLTGCADFAKGFSDGLSQQPINRGSCCGSGVYSYAPPSPRCLQQCDQNTSWCWKSAKEDNSSYGYDYAMRACGESNRLCKQECSR